MGQPDEHYSRYKKALEPIECLIKECDNFTRTGICGNCVFKLSRGGVDAKALLHAEAKIWCEWARLHHPSTCLVEECPDCGVRDCMTADPGHHLRAGCPSCKQIVEIDDDF